MSRYEKIYVKFDLKRKDGSSINLRIEDLPLSRRDEAFDFFIKYFLPDEGVHKGACRNEEAFTEIKEILKKYRKEHPPVILCCTLDSSTSDVDEILGLSFMHLKNGNLSRSLSSFVTRPKTKQVQQIFDILKMGEELTAANSVELCYHLRELMVHPEYRGLGISDELLKASKLKCKKDKVPVLRAWMTAAQLQRVAETNHWKVLAEIKVEELVKITGAALDSKVASFKLMSTCVD